MSVATAAKVMGLLVKVATTTASFFDKITADHINCIEN